MAVSNTTGALFLYGPDGELTREIDTGLEFTNIIRVHPTSGKLAIGGIGVAVVDPLTGDVQTLRQVDTAVNFRFVKAGELLAIANNDGTVRLWDVQRGVSAGLIWRGSVQRADVPDRDDDSSDSMWIQTSSKLIEISLDPEFWLKRACEVVGRDFTQGEWDLFVPGGGPVQSACG